MLSNKDGVIKVKTDGGMVLFHTSHVIQVPCDPSTQGVYGDKRPSHHVTCRVLQIQLNFCKDYLFVDSRESANEGRSVSDLQNLTIFNWFPGFNWDV